MNELQSINDLFKNRIFRIPNYQRGYAWQNPQLSDFWKDVIILPQDKSHYTGVLSLKKIENIDEKYKDERWLIEQGVTPFHIVDGQQRLTTCVIFIQAFIEFFEEKNPNIIIDDKSLSELKTYYLYQEKDNKILTAYKFGYEVDNPSFNYLKQKIFNSQESGNVQETFYTLNLEKAKSFFKEEIESLFNKKNDENSEQNGEDSVIELFTKITQNFLFNIYEISNDFNVFVAFETMNNRGKKLSNLELLKNRILYLITLYDSHVLSKDDENTLTDFVNETWSEIYYQLGRNKNNPLSDDDFLRNYWIIYFHYTKKRGSDYIDYFLNEKFTAEQIYDYNHGNGEGLDPEKLKDYLNKLKLLSQHWYNIHFPNENYSPKERLWLNCLNRLGFMYFRPLITVLFLKNSGIKTGDRVKILKSIERFIFIHFRLNRNQSNSGETPFYNLANRIASQTDQDSENNIEKIDKALKEQLHRWFKKTDDGKDLFEPKYFNDYIQTRHLGFYGWNGLHYFLYEYEYSLFSNYGNEKIEWSLFVKPDGNDKVSIEHIYPQNPKDEDWQDFINYSADERKLLQNSLGNLLPLSFSINSSLQNTCFKDKKNQKLDAKGNEKRRGYTQGSHCEIEVAKNEIWTADTIKQRGLKLLEFMEKRWDISLGDDLAKIQKIQLLGLSFLDDAKIEKEKQ